MSILSAGLAAGRRQANARMTETFQFYTVALTEQEGSFDDVPVETNIVSSPGRLKMAGVQAQTEETADQFVVVDRREIHLPTTVALVPVGAMARCTASSADSSLVGRVFRVVAKPASGQVTAHRYPVEEVS